MDSIRIIEIGYNYMYVTIKMFFCFFANLLRIIKIAIITCHHVVITTYTTDNLQYSLQL